MLAARLQALDPHAVLARGYALAADADGHIVTDAAGLRQVTCCSCASRAAAPARACCTPNPRPRPARPRAAQGDAPGGTASPR